MSPDMGNCEDAQLWFAEKLKSGNRCGPPAADQLCSCEIFAKYTTYWTLKSHACSHTPIHCSRTTYSCHAFPVPSTVFLTVEASFAVAKLHFAGGCSL